MKNLNCFKVIIGGMFLALIFCSSNAFSQGTNWRLNGNSNVGQDDFIGTKNDADFVIRTNNRERIRVTTDNYTIFEDSVRIKGPLHIGDSSLVVGQINGFPGDNIQSSAGHVNFGNTVMFNFSNIKIGIGLTAPQHKLHINDRNQFIFGQPNPVFSAYTNQAFGGGTGATATDGFLVGINSDGTAELRQQENQDIWIFTGAGTNNHSRMVIKGEEGDNQGFVGVGTSYSNPLSVLHIDANNMATGEIFRTNGPATVFNRWRFFTGGTTGTEKFQIFTSTNLGTANGTLQNDQNITLQSTQRDMIFNAGGDGSNFERMRILGQDHDLSTNTPWFATARAGNVGIGTPHPLCMLQIGGEAAAGAGWREWMDIGTYYASEGGFDNMYVGLRRRDNTQMDRNEAIINWGNNPTTQQGSFDRLRFVFTANAFVGLLASGEDGLEVARMISDGNQGFVGIGNFFTDNIDPTETLDVNGNARIRDLINHQDESLTRCVVIDDDGVLHWRNFEGGGPGTSLGNECDGPITNPLNVNWEIPLDDYNFVFSGQVQDKTRVGIGIDDCQPDAKLDVLMNSGESGSIALKSVVENGENSQIGIFGHSTTSSPLALGIGIFGLSQYSNINMGVTGIAWNAIPAIMDATYNFGGFFMADYGRINAAGYFNAPSNDPSSVNNYGVYSVCQPPVTGAYGNWAGYFLGHVNVEGNIQHTGTYTNTSDQKFKQDIVDYSGALGKIRDLRPVNFYFDTVNYDLNFPTDMQYGLIAQEVETVFPELISNEIIPEKFDTAGNIISEVIHYKGLEYGQLTPILVQAVKEIDNNLTEIVKIPEPPVLISPENNDTVYGYGASNKVSSFSEIFTWNYVDEAICYIVDYSYTSDMSDLYRSQVVFDTVMNMGFSYQQDTTMYWAVRSVGAFGLSDYSEIRYFILHYTYDDNYTKSVSELSDITLKTNVNEIEDALTKTMSLQGVSFEWDIANNPGRNLSEGTNLGLIAQEVQPIFPEVVSSDENGILYIDYSSLVPVLVESVKELKYINDSLSESVSMLESRLNNLEQFVFDNLGEIETKMTNPAEFQQEVVLENKLAIVLNQNVPNPFREQTTISFQIPESVKEAKIVFIDNLGNILKQVEIQERGCGELLVYAYDLSAGNYTYYLVADGMTIESKKMVLTK